MQPTRRQWPPFIIIIIVYYYHSDSVLQYFQDSCLSYNRSSWQLESAFSSICIYRFNEIWVKIDMQRWIKSVYVFIKFLCWIHHKDNWQLHVWLNLWSLNVIVFTRNFHTFQFYFSINQFVFFSKSHWSQGCMTPSLLILYLLFVDFECDRS